MDPNAALTSILCGHMVADHVEALSDWLASGGFAPEPILMPVDKHPYFAAHCERNYGCARGYAIDVKANAVGLWTQGAVDRAKDDWQLIARWPELRRLADSEY